MSYKDRRARKLQDLIEIKLDCLGACDDTAFSEDAIARFLASVIAEFKNALVAMLPASYFEDIAIARLLDSEACLETCPIPARLPALPGISGFASLSKSGCSPARYLSLSFAILLDNASGKLRDLVLDMPVGKQKVLLADGLAVALAVMDRACGCESYEQWEAGGPMPWQFQYANETRRQYYTSLLASTP